jgi:RNA polymerase sigma factor (sigma-70 family)
MGGVVPEIDLEGLDSVALRVAAARAAWIVVSYRLPSELCRDLKQEALLELWRRRDAFDPLRGSWRTFAEHVVRNRLTSLLQVIQSTRPTQFVYAPLESLSAKAAPDINVDLRLDIERVLASVSQFDRTVARSLAHYSAIETGRSLGTSRAAVYRAIKRIRAAFSIAGFSMCGHTREIRQRGVRNERDCQQFTHGC